ncbi:MAG: flagellar hook protein FlgE [Azoarcus sp.]|jgi:flagellar hook protein FlgE|nr:flagellar hook protein FlgE [Azoarcus sp.]
MAFQQGLSGLNVSSKALDVISNNIANASTVGFKAANTIFADIFTGALSGTSSNIQVGTGAKVTAVYQNFADGLTTTTSNPLDMAIIGNGFYVIQRNDGSTAYSRNGQFDIDKDGYIVTPLGEKLMGIRADVNGFISPSGGIVEPLFVSQGDIDPRATTEFNIKSGNLDARINPGFVDVDQTTPLVTPFNPTNVDSYHYMTTIPVYDTLGMEHSLQAYCVKTGPIPPATGNGTWDVYAMIDNDPTTLQGPGVITFDTTGKLLTPAGTPTFPGLAFPVTSGANNLTIDVNLGQITQYGSAFSVTDISQDGYTSGQISSIVVAQDGTIQGRYTNGQAKNLGQVVLATFRSNQGLTSVGDNLWIESPDSGPAIVGRPTSGLNGLISGGQVEESNVDLTQELVNMIIQQRNYQANAQTIKTQDQIMSTLVNLR